MAYGAATPLHLYLPFAFCPLKLQKENFYTAPLHHAFQRMIFIIIYYYLPNGTAFFICCVFGSGCISYACALFLHCHYICCARRFLRILRIIITLLWREEGGRRRSFHGRYLLSLRQGAGRRPVGLGQLACLTHATTCPTSPPATTSHHRHSPHCLCLCLSLSSLLTSFSPISPLSSIYPLSEKSRKGNPEGKEGN